MVWKLHHLGIKLSRGDYSLFLLSDKQKNTKPQVILKEHQQKHPPHQSKMIPKPLIVGRMSLQICRSDMALVSRTGFKYGQKSYLKELMGNIIFSVENTSFHSFIWKLVPYGFGVLIFSFWLLCVHSVFTWLQVWPVMLCWVQPSNCATAHAIAMQLEICKLKFWCHYVKGILCTLFRSNTVLGHYFCFLL